MTSKSSIDFAIFMLGTGKGGVGFQPTWRVGYGVPAGSRHHEGRCRLEAGSTREGAGWKPASRGLFLGDVDGVAVAFEEGVFAGVFKV